MATKSWLTFLITSLLLQSCVPGASEPAKKGQYTLETDDITAISDEAGRFRLQRDKLEYTIYPQGERIVIDVKNTSDGQMAIVWDKTTIVGPDGLSASVFHNDVFFVDKDRSQRDTIVPRNSYIRDSVYPSSYTRYIERSCNFWSCTDAHWEHNKIFAVGDRYSTTLNVTILNNGKEKLHDFKIRQNY